MAKPWATGTADGQQAEDVSDALYAYLASHARRELRVINGKGHQYLVFCQCPLCVAALPLLGISEEDAASYEVVHDSDPAERVSAEAHAES